MKTLIVEDDFTNRLLLQTFLSRFGECHVAVNGKEAVDAFRSAQDGGLGYDLICMDILMPEMDGHEAVEAIRTCERDWIADSVPRARIIMTTSLNDISHVTRSVRADCDAYLLKPIDLSRLLHQLKSLGLVAM